MHVLPILREMLRSGHNLVYRYLNIFDFCVYFDFVLHESLEVLQEDVGEDVVVVVMVARWWSIMWEHHSKIFAPVFYHLCQLAAMDCCDFIWSLCPEPVDDSWEPTPYRRRRVWPDFDDESINFENSLLFGPSSSESDLTVTDESVPTVTEESVPTRTTSPSLAVESDVQMPCEDPLPKKITEHFYIGVRTPTEDPPPYLADPIIQPQPSPPVRVYHQIQGEWAKMKKFSSSGRV